MKRLLSTLVVPLISLALGCGAKPVATAPPKANVIAGRLHASANASPAKGRLAVAWLSAAEAKKWKDGDVDGWMFRTLISRFVPGPEVDLARQPAYSVEAPRDATPLVVVDVNGSFWETLFGGGHGFVGLGNAGGGDVEMKPAPPPKPPGTEPCSGPRMELLVVKAPELAGSVGNPTDRRFCTYLPASYASAAARRYPVVFLFGGFMSNEMVRFRGKRNAMTVADEIFRETGQEAILVGVDASTKTGSSYLEDSPITGQWDTWLAGPALAAIDGHFRTLGVSTSRGLIGQSTGGFLAVSQAMKHPTVYGAMGATSPDALDLDAWMLEGTRVKPWIVGWTRLEATLGGPGQMTSYAADWSNGQYPFDFATAKPNPVYAQWQAHSPGKWLDDPAKAAKIKDAYSGKILIAASTNDEFDLTDPAVAFSKKLTKLHIANELDLSPAGHLDGGQDRTEQALRFVISKLDKASNPEVMVVGTEHGGHVTSPGYPMTKLGAILDAYKPDLVLVEIRPEPFAAGHYEDGPLEMSYLTLLAKQRGVAVAPIDWWREADHGKPEPIVDREVAKEAEALDTYGTFEELNSPERARRVIALRNAMTRLGAGEGVTWERRQAWFNRQAADAIEKSHARRVLAFVGFSHRPELEAYLVTAGLHAEDPRALKTAEPAPTVPAEVVAFWKDGISQLKKAHGTERKVASWEKAITLQGACCAAK